VFYLNLKSLALKKTNLNIGVGETLDFERVFHLTRKIKNIVSKELFTLTEYSHTQPSWMCHNLSHFPYFKSQLKRRYISK